ncbi:hypothetical protein J6590_069662, partial [Homalodisca vitripennis]
MDNIADALFPIHPVREYQYIPVDPGQITFLTDVELSHAVGQIQCCKAETLK